MVIVKIKINGMEFSEEEARQIYEHLKKYFGKVEYTPAPGFKYFDPVWIDTTFGYKVTC